MQCDSAKDFLPFSEAKEVIDGIEYTDNRVELFGNAEAGHTLPVKTDVWQPLAREREHFPRAVKTRDFVSVGKKTQDAACAGSDFKDGFCLWLVALDETTSEVRRHRPVTHDEIIESGKTFIGHNRVIFVGCVVPCGRTQIEQP